MRSKIIFSFFMSFVVLGGILIWSTDRSLNQQKLAWAESQSKAQISSLVLAVQGQLQALLTEAQSASAIKVRRELLFWGTIEITPTSELQFTRSNSGVAAPKPWMTSYSLLALKGMDPSPQKMKIDEMMALTVLDPDRKAHVLLLKKTASREFAVALTESSIFQTLMDRQKGFSGEVFVLNSQAQTVAHSEPVYVGTLLKTEPTAAAYLDSSSRIGGGLYGEASTKVLGFFEQVPTTNLAVLVSTSVAKLQADRVAQLMPLVALLGGLLLIGLAILYFLFKEDSFEDVAIPRPGARPLQAPALSSIGSGQVPTMPAAPAPRMDMQVEMKEAHRKVASALSHEMRSPLAAIIGNVQLAKSSLQSSPESAASFLEKIENEARWMRDLVSKLSNFAGEKTNSTTTEALPVVLARALTRIDSKLSAKGIKLTKNIDDSVGMTVPTDPFLKAMEAIFKNAIESMERAPRKELLVQLTQSESGVEISCADTGEGIAPENFGRLFDPFYTTKTSKENLGLGLSMAEGVFREHSGKISVKSEKGKGSEFVVHFPVPVSSVVMKAPVADLKPAPSSVVAQLPPAPEEFEPTVVLDPLLDSSKIDQILEGEDDFEPTAILHGEDEFEPTSILEPQALKESAIEGPATADSSPKIDPPKPKRKKANDPFAQVEVNLRRPGAKL